jgi:nucleotide-binding universal stress UspA family protein
MSTIRSVLLHLDSTPASAARLEFARNLALRHQAALSAMFVAAAPYRPVQLAFSESPAALLQPVDRAALEHTKAWFDDAVARGDYPTRWLDCGSADPVGAFFDQALYADLLVLGQDDPTGAWPGAAPAGFVQSALLATGKPALVLPFTGQFEPPGQDVLIGWSATPQAARAVAAALPWLRTARRVHVLEAIDAPAPLGAEGLDVEKYLHFHGIEAVPHTHRASPADAGDALLAWASDVGADLLVMGCYGHTRAREFVLGGASRSVLRSMTLPVLMAH